MADFAGRRHHWQGRAVRLAGAIDEQSRLVPVVVEIPDPYRQTGDRPPLVEGMFVTASIRGRALPGTVAIPRSALRADDRIWLVDREGRLEIRDVTVARAGIERAIIAEGLQAGEIVCLSSLQYVSNGMLVRTAADEAATTAPAATATTTGPETSIEAEDTIGAATTGGAATAAADQPPAGGQAE
jgi:hypothetical protein